MTAEVAILNKTAVALAADSAITFSGKKIYNSGNKLFTLSKYQPVGIMIFGNAEFMNVPWETIIKFYREHLLLKRFPKLIDYANDFLNFLEHEALIFWPPEVQKAYFRDVVYGYFSTIRKKIDGKVEEELKTKQLLVDDVSNIIDTVVQSDYNEWVNADDLFTDCNSHLDKILSLYDDVLNNGKNDIFQQLPFSDLANNLIFKIVGLIFCKHRFNSEINSGVVVAGFGHNEIFPSFVEYGFEAITAGKLKYRQKQYMEVTRQTNAIISAFAQNEMVLSFLQGIDPEFRTFLDSYFENLLNGYPKNILDIIPELTPERRNELLTRLGKVSVDAFTDLTNNINDYASSNHVNPVLQAVSALPKDELASMAESLVNMTSFKRRVSMQAETVGGPIDVAVISKGDGFIWIKRKHYFKPEFNPGFISNYFREDLIDLEGCDQNEEIKYQTYKKNCNI